MKGGEVSMLHIIVKNGMVIGVIELGKSPDDPPRYLEEEFDYKIENHDQYEEEEG
jgi:hypothetical protein